MPQIGQPAIFNQCILWSVKPNEQPEVFCVWQGLTSEINGSLQIKMIIISVAWRW